MHRNRTYEHLNWNMTPHKSNIMGVIIIIILIWNMMKIVELTTMLMHSKYFEAATP